MAGAVVLARHPPLLVVADIAAGVVVMDPAIGGVALNEHVREGVGEEVVELGLADVLDARLDHQMLDDVLAVRPAPADGKLWCASGVRVSMGRSAARLNMHVRISIRVT